jgi:hypothetical protein
MPTANRSPEVLWKPAQDEAILPYGLPRFRHTANAVGILLLFACCVAAARAGERELPQVPDLNVRLAPQKDMSADKASDLLLARLIGQFVREPGRFPARTQCLEFMRLLTRFAAEHPEHQAGLTAKLLAAQVATKSGATVLPKVEESCRESLKAIQKDYPGTWQAALAHVGLLSTELLYVAIERPEPEVRGLNRELQVALRATLPFAKAIDADASPLGEALRAMFVGINQDPLVVPSVWLSLASLESELGNDAAVISICEHVIKSFPDTKAEWAARDEIWRTRVKNSPTPIDGPPSLLRKREPTPKSTNP